MSQEKKGDQVEENKSELDNQSNKPLSDNEDLHKEIKNANAAGLGSLGRSDETIENTDNVKKESDSTPY